jgi:two-component system, chemotaxis family, response regulator PixG
MSQPAIHITSKLDPTELLLKSVQLKRTGCFELTRLSVSWRVYLHQGQLQYVDCSVESIAQLKYYLMRQGCKNAAMALNEARYPVEKNLGVVKQSLYQQAIVWLVAEQYIDNTQFVKLIGDISQDVLESCLWLTEGTSDWHEGKSIPDWIENLQTDSLALNIASLVDLYQQKLKKWQNCATQLVSPHQRPYFLNYRDIHQDSSVGILSENVLNELAQVMRTGLSFRQLSHFLKKEELQVAQILSPYIQKGLIHLREPQSPLNLLPSIPKYLKIERTNNLGLTRDADKIHKIVCVDDSRIILQEIKRFLPEDRFDITAIDEPIRASSTIFRLEPDLIMLDITMPKINGYTLCSLLRNSDTCKTTPIIMVTGNTGLIDKARAKLAGANDYLTKPFSREGLMAVVDKYLK